MGFIPIVACTMWWLLLLGACMVSTRSDNPTSIVPPLPGPDPGYIIAESDTGLANRLRVLAAYMGVAKYKFEDAHLVFIWETNEACPGHFLSLFEPIPSVIFATNQSRFVLDKHAKINYENSNAVFPWIMQMNNIPKHRFGHPTWGEIEYHMYSRYFPRREIMYQALYYVEKYNICNASAMHIRQTDMALAVERKSNGRKKMSIASYIRYVDSRPADEPVFLLTDNPQTQQFFLDKYGPQKILVASSMNESMNQLPMHVQRSSDIAHLLLNGKPLTDSTLPVGSGSIKAEDHRFTTLENTLLDVLIAAHAKDFKASIFSSLSELVHMFGQVGKRDRGWCANRH